MKRHEASWNVLMRPEVAQPHVQDFEGSTELTGPEQADPKHLWASSWRRHCAFVVRTTRQRVWSGVANVAILQVVMWAVVRLLAISKISFS